MAGGLGATSEVVIDGLRTLKMRRPFATAAPVRRYYDELEGLRI